MQSKIDKTLKTYEDIYRETLNLLSAYQEKLPLYRPKILIDLLKDLLKYWQSLDEKRKIFLEKAINYLYTWEFLGDKAKKNLIEKLTNNIKFHFLPQKLEDILKEEKEKIKKHLKYLKRETPKFIEKEKKFDLSILNYPISSLKNLENKYRNVFKKLSLKYIKDIFYYFPKKYEDRKTVYPIKYLNLDEVVNVVGEIKHISYLETKKGKIVFKATLEDGTGKIHLVYIFSKKNERFFKFYKKFFEKAKKLKIKVIARGKVGRFEDNLAIFHPEVDYLTFPLKNFGSYFPIYPGYSKISLSRLINAFEKAVSTLAPYLPEYLPKEILEKYSFPSYGESIFYIHVPNTNIDFKLYENFETPYHKRLFYDEVFLMQLAILKQKFSREKIKEDLNIEEKDLEPILKTLPFELTNAQKRVMKEILKDLKEGKLLSRLIQGDVGSGKTIIAILAAYLFAKKGYQVAVMCPTEILAFQHYQKFKAILEKLNIKVGYLVGSLKPSQKKEVYKQLENGEIKVVIGTHALFQKDVKFKNLKLVIIDEQHRFGVEQRLSLKEKAHNPHILVMTATPIPRTLALSLYGDLDVSIIDELPGGRKKIITKVIFENEITSIFPLLNKELKEGRKAYVIYPLIEENEKLEEIKSLEKMQEFWKKHFKDFEIYVLHGKMKDEEKYEVMKKFKESKRGAILLSTTVVEVGVDVPEATIMIIENAERFGLSQLHQLRGRVGRGPYQSYCFLVCGKKTSEKSLERLYTLEKYTDGFKISEEDLKLRGAGEFFGTRQSGKSDFFIFDFEKVFSLKLLEQARKDALEILQKSPDLSKYPRLSKMLKVKFEEKDTYLKV